MRRRLLLRRGIGGGGFVSTYTLVAEAGSLILSGETMTPLVDYRLPAGAGSFALTGVAAGLLAARTMPAAAGSFALTGQDATLTYTPIVSGSAWGDHGTNVGLSTTTIANDTAAAAGGAPSAYSAVRGSQAHTAGKWYFEVKVLTAPAAPVFQIGVMDNTTANGASMDNTPGSTNFASANNNFNGEHDGNWNGVNIGAGWALANGDVMGYAYDGDNNFGYLALSNTYFLSGDPASGATGTGAIMTPASQTGVRPAVWIFGSGIGGVYQLITTASAFTYTPPSGYSEWG